MGKCSTYFQAQNKLYSSQTEPGDEYFSLSEYLNITTICWQLRARCLCTETPLIFINLPRQDTESGCGGQFPCCLPLKSVSADRAELWEGTWKYNRETDNCDLFCHHDWIFQIQQGCDAASPHSYSIRNLFLDMRIFGWIFSKLGQEVRPDTLC